MEWPQESIGADAPNMYLPRVYLRGLLTRIRLPESINSRLSSRDTLASASRAHPLELLLAIARHQMG